MKPDLFPRPPRKSPRVLMHVIDAGAPLCGLPNTKLVGPYKDGKPPAEPLSMRERMARAMAKRAGIDPDAKGYGTDQDGKRCDPFLWELYLPFADAALDAQADKSEGMCGRMI